jgi:DNA-binding MarR family transcriptional regulator
MKEIISRISKVFENKARLGVMSALMANQSLDFASLKELLELTDGNLSSNLSVLEDLKYVKITKEFVGKKTRTSVVATKEGRAAFEKHLKALEDLISQSKMNRP